MNENIKQFIVCFLLYRLCGQVCSLFGIPGLYPNAISGICLILFSRSTLAADNRQSLSVTARLLPFTFAFFFLTQYFSICAAQLFRDFSPYYSQAVKQSPFLLKIAVIGLISPAAEEILFRRLLYQGLKPLGIIKSSLSSSIIFGLCHGNVLQGVYSAFWGILFCILYEKYRDLRIPILIHMISNLLSLSQILRISMTNFYVTVCLTFVSVCVVYMTIKKKGECI